MSVQTDRVTQLLIERFGGEWDYSEPKAHWRRFETEEGGNKRIKAIIYVCSFELAYIKLVSLTSIYGEGTFLYLEPDLSGWQEDSGV